MSKVGDLIEKIKSQHIGATGKKALIVEGPDDVEFFQALLDRRYPQWEQNWVVAAATGKHRVLDILGAEASWLGVVDKDEWTNMEALEAVASHPNLFVLPRFCVESYFVDPAEIWLALPEKQRGKIPGGAAQLRTEIELGMNDWKRHAALWHVVHPIYRHLRSADHRDSLLDPTDVPNDAKLEHVIGIWLQRFDADKIRAEVAARIAMYDDLDPAEFYWQHLYAKKFYPLVVHGAMNKLLGQRSEKHRRQALLRSMPVPADLAPLWLRMGG